MLADRLTLPVDQLWRDLTIAVQQAFEPLLPGFSEGFECDFCFVHTNPSQLRIGRMPESDKSLASDDLPEHLLTRLVLPAVWYD